MTPRLQFLDLRQTSARPMDTPPARSVLCLGNFDGVHRAHMALLREGQRLAHSLCSPDTTDVLCGVFCFFRPSIDYVGRPSEGSPTHLTTLRERLALFAAAGVDFVCLCDFPAVRHLAPDDFMALLDEACGCEGVVCGFNHRFGQRAAGDPSLLTTYFGRDRVMIMPEMRMDGLTVSSTRIRACLAEGDAETAARLLGRPYSLTATVTRGKQLGRTMGFPTANQYFHSESLVPAHGVYVARCHTPTGSYLGVANVGCHPTVDAHARVNCETYIIGYEGDLYGKRLTVEFLRHLRRERKFADVHELTAAIRQDAATAAAYTPTPEV